jgi:23S rRNA (guanosine2251-2'-O)-methyltransferase
VANPSLTLRNPHSVLAALEARPGDIERITLPSTFLKGADRGDPALGRDAWLKVFHLARKHRIDIHEARAPERGPKPAVKEARESGFEALVEPKQPISLEEMFGQETDGDQGLWIAVDQIQDPHNLGAIFRTAAFFGVKGIVTTFERAAPLTSTVYDVACGGVDAVPFAIETNLVRCMEKAKDLGLWTLGTSEHAQTPLAKIPRDRKWLLVLGNEEKGLRKLTLENCDMVCAIPPQGSVVTSLNVSVAAGILISSLS